MTLDRAIEILNPEHRENYDCIEPVSEACRMGMDALQKIRDGKLVEVVHCCECKHARPVRDAWTDVIGWTCILQNQMKNDDGYCEEGEWDDKTEL